MSKQTKNIITRRDVAESLLFTATADVRYYADFEPYWPSHTVYQLADAADLFYLAHLTGAKHILRAYLGDMYEYKSNS